MFPPSRIVCLTEETVETLYLLGEQDRIVGISEYVVPGSDMEGSISGDRPIAKGDASQVRNGLFAGGRWIRTLGPPQERKDFYTLPLDYNRRRGSSCPPQLPSERHAESKP